MKIRWARVAALLLSVLASLLLATLWGPMVTFLSSAASIVDLQSTPEEHMKGMMAFALVMVCVLVIIRLLVDSNRKDS